MELMNKTQNHRAPKQSNKSKHNFIYRFQKNNAIKLINQAQTNLYVQPSIQYLSISTYKR